MVVQTSTINLREATINLGAAREPMRASGIVFSTWTNPEDTP